MESIDPCLTVAVSGHRWNKLSVAAGVRVAEQLREIFAEIDRAVRKRRVAESGSDGRAKVRLISGLAEGVDQLAVSNRPESWQLHAILPFPRQQYEHDFAPAHTTDGVDRRGEFTAALAQAATITELPDTGDAVDGYERAGQWMLQRSDVLVAVWDGEAGSGRGGTESVIRHAIASAVPTLWIRADREAPPCLISGPGDLERLISLPQATPDRVDGLVASLLHPTKLPHNR